MESESPENGMDELIRLSQQFRQQEHQSEEREKQRNEQRKKVQGVLGGLRELTISTTVEQLKSFATPEFIKQVDSLKGKPGTADLRELISDLTNDLEERIGVIATTYKEVKPIEQSQKTLTILLELLFSLE